MRAGHVWFVVLSWLLFLAITFGIGVQSLPAEEPHHFPAGSLPAVLQEPAWPAPTAIALHRLEGCRDVSCG